MNSQPRTPAEQTAALLQQAAQSGSPVLIPGAREPRTGRHNGRPTQGSDLLPTPHGHMTTVFGRERLEREREGGGAPSERAIPRLTTFARVWHRLLHSI
jgi:hypothetical protein